MKCPNCGAEMLGTICEYCKTEVHNASNPQTQQPINIIINNTNSGYGFRYVNAKKARSNKSKSVAIALCCLSFIGLGGMHRFYVGKKVSGVVHLFTIGFFFIGAIIDLKSLAKGQFTDSNGLKLK